MKRPASAMKRVVVRPARPPIRLVFIVVSDALQHTTVAVGSRQFHFQRPTGVVDGADAGTKAMLPIAIALRCIPAR